MTIDEAKENAAIAAATLQAVAPLVPHPGVQAGLYLGSLALSKGVPAVADLIAALRKEHTDEEIIQIIAARWAKGYETYDPHLEEDLANGSDGPV